MNAFDKALIWLKERKPFALFSLPESKQITGTFQQNNGLHLCTDFSRSGFVFAPFDYKTQTLFIPVDEAESITHELPEIHIEPHQVGLKYSDEEKIQYLDLVNKTIDYINQSNTQKIVTSRKITANISSVDYLKLFKRLFIMNPNAFRYVWYHPYTGMWCGATPEVLVQTKDISFATMALAGTKKVIEGSKPQWTPKEIMEQQFVKDAILDALEEVTSVLRASKTYSYQAGQVVHLRTDITGVFNYRKTNLFSITQALHPTPAVCGTPRDKALKFILENENYNREFYAGFLGNVCGESACSNFFVNLRCMKIENNQATLYVGGGITFDSIAENEWTETQNKLLTMLNVMAPFLT